MLPPIDSQAKRSYLQRQLSVAAIMNQSALASARVTACRTSGLSGGWETAQIASVEAKSRRSGFVLACLGKLVTAFPSFTASKSLKEASEMPSLLEL